MRCKGLLGLAIGCLLLSSSVMADEGFLGDMLGARSWLAEHGIDYHFSATQFYQGVSSGGREQDWDYGGKLDYFIDLDAQKLGFGEGFFVSMHAETRFGESVNNHDGLLLPANIAMSFPDAQRHVTSITGLKLMQFLSESFLVFAGKINTLDEYALQLPGGPGLGGFMNTSMVFNPIAARTVPYAAAGTGFAFVKDFEPVFSFTVFDPEERATEGLEDLYARGVTIMPDFIFRVKPFGLPGIYNFGGTYSNSDYTSVDPSAWLGQLPEVPGAPVENESWSLYFDFYQAIWANARNEKQHFGFFGQFGISDGNPNPIRYVANGGLGGMSTLPGREQDRFGIGFFYLGLSDNFKTLTRPFVPQRDEYGAELFYNFAITPHCWLTGDLQVARPSTIAFDTVIIPGLRLEMIF